LPPFFARFFFGFTGPNSSFISAMIPGGAPLGAALMHSASRDGC
jgi:hypothetical protein